MNGTNEHRCPICLKAFTRNSSLQVHLKKQVCQQLGRREGQLGVAFAPSSTVTTLPSNHQLQTGQNPKNHQCTFCLRTFTKRSSLNTHIQMKRCSSLTPNSGLLSVAANQNSVLPASALINYSLDHYSSQLLKQQSEQYAKLFANKSPQNGHQTQSAYLKGQIYQCGICPKSFPELGSLNEHYQCTHNRCTFCNTFYKSLKDLMKHMEAVHQVRNLTSSIPDVKAQNGNNKKKDLGKEDGNASRQYECGVCSKRFHRKSCLTEHLLTHSGIRPYSCTLCSMSFTKNYNLTVHMGTHSNARPYKCVLCEADFKRNDYLKAHMKSTHNITLGQQPRSLQLPTSKPALVQPTPIPNNNTSNHLNNVYQFLSSAAPNGTAASLPIALPFFVQPQAPLTSSLSFSLSSSLPVQPPPQPSSSLALPVASTPITKPYRCTACSKDFKLKSSLQRHSLLHSGPKKHPCSHCTRAFTTKSHLIEHNLRMHSALRQHACPHCRMAFRKRGELTDHLRTHSEERPFPCELCGKAFKHQKNQKYHLRKVHHANGT